MALGTTGIVMRVWWLIAWPLLLLIVAVLVEHEPKGEAALVFFMLAPYVAFPLVWLAGSFAQAFEVDEHFVVEELLGGGVVCGFLLPVIVLVPLHQAASLAGMVDGMLLAFIIMLPAVWVPIPLAILWTPLLLDEKESSPDSSPPASLQEHLVRFFTSDISLVYFAMFVTLSIPLGFFLPLLLGTAPSDRGGAALIFFGLMTCACGFFLLLAPRLAMLVGTYERRVSEALVKLLGGGFVLPVLVLLPLFFETAVGGDARRMLLAFVVALPSVSAIEAVRVLNWEDRDLLVSSETVLISVLVLPLGFLLPIWLAVSPGCAAQIALLALMLTPTAVLLCVALVITAQTTSSFPFVPLNTVLPDREYWVEVVYVTLAIFFPVILLLPVFFHGDLCDAAGFVVLAFMLLLFLQLAVAFYISLASGSFRAPLEAPRPSISSAKDVNGMAAMTGAGASGNGHANGNGGGPAGDGNAMNLGPAHRQFCLDDYQSRGPSESTSDSALPQYLDVVSPEPIDWEPASRWEIEPNQGNLSCISERCMVKIDESEGTAKHGNRFMVYPLELYQDRGIFVGKGPFLDQQELASELGTLQRASQCAHDFNLQLQEAVPNAPVVSFVEAFALDLESRISGSTSWCLAETDVVKEQTQVTGRPQHFYVWSTARGLVTEPGDVGLTDASDPDYIEYCRMRDVAEAFTCYSYYWSQKQYVFLDIRGVGARFSIPVTEYVSDPPENDPAHFFLRNHRHNRFCSKLVVMPRMFDHRSADAGQPSLPPPPVPPPEDVEQFANLPPPMLPGETTGGPPQYDEFDDPSTAWIGAETSAFPPPPNPPPLEDSYLDTF